MSSDNHLHYPPSFTSHHHKIPPMPSLLFRQDNTSPGSFLTHSIDILSHELIHNDSCNSYTYIKELEFFGSKLNLEKYGRVFTRMRIALLVEMINRDTNGTTLEKWNEQDWSVYIQDFIAVHQSLIRKDADHFFIGCLQDKAFHTDTEEYQNEVKKELRDSRIIAKVKKMLHSDFIKILLALEFQKAISIIRSFIKQRLLETNDKYSTIPEKVLEKFTVFIANSELNSHIDDRHRKELKECLCALLDDTNDLTSLKSPSDLRELLLQNVFFQKNFFIGNVIERVSSTLSNWEISILSAPAKYSFIQNDQHAQEELDENLNSQSIESNDEENGIAFSNEDEENSSDEQESIADSQDDDGSDSDSYEQLETQPQRKYNIENESNGDSSSEQILDKDHMSLQDLQHCRENLRKNVEDPLEDALKIASTAQTVTIGNATVDNSEKSLEDNDTINNEVPSNEAPSPSNAIGNDADPSPSNALENDSNDDESPDQDILSTKSKKRQIDASQDSNDLWEDSQDDKIFQKKKPRKQWTTAETNALIKGHEKHGQHWSAIRTEFYEILKDRDQIAIKVSFLDCVPLFKLYL